MTNCSKIIYLIGRPGCGKYTIAQEICKYGFILCDNHLINNPIFSLLNYSKIPDYGWESIDLIRKAVLGFLAQHKQGNYVLTNVLYETDEDHQIYKQVEQMALRRESIFLPIKLIISQEENLKRITQLSRHNKWKSVDPEDILPKNELIRVPYFFELDVTNLLPHETAQKILDKIRF